MQRAVRQTLLDQSPVPGMAHAPRTWPSPQWERRQTLVAAGRDEAATTQMAAQRAMDLYRPLGGEPGDEPQPVGPVRLPLLRVVGQVGQTYVVAEGPQGMYLIDQHAAHERVLYEQMMAEREGQDVASQALLEPLTVDLDPLLAGVLGEHLAMLNSVGFELSEFGGTSYLLRAVPAILVVPDVSAALVDILEMLRQGDDPLAAQAEERLVATVCKRAAIKAGQTLYAGRDAATHPPARAVRVTPDLSARAADGAAFYGGAVGKGIWTAVKDGDWGLATRDRGLGSGRDDTGFGVGIDGLYWQQCGAGLPGGGLDGAGVQAGVEQDLDAGGPGCRARHRRPGGRGIAGGGHGGL